MTVEKLIANKRNREGNQKYHSLLNIRTVILLFLIGNILLENNERILAEEYSEIHLVFQATGGEQQIIKSDFNISLFQFLLDGTSSSCSKTCNLGAEGTNHNVILRINPGMTSLYLMFKDTTKMKEIDFSNFDFSTVTDISYMLENCKDLTSVNFGKLKIMLIKTV